jgi:hypothetical protein
LSLPTYPVPRLDSGQVSSTVAGGGARTSAGLPNLDGGCFTFSPLRNLTRHIGEISSRKMDLSMTCAAKSDEILLNVTSQSASRLHVMNLEIFRRSASLASPAVAFENRLA